MVKAMKYLAVLVALVAGSAHAQTGTALHNEAFTGTADPIGGSWSQLNDGTSRIAKATDQLTASHVGQASARWTGATFSETQYAKVTLADSDCVSTSQWTGVILNASSGTNAARDFYVLYFDPGLNGHASGETENTVIATVTNGTFTTLDSDAAVAWSDGDVLGMSYDAATDTLVAYKNNTPITGLTATSTAQAAGSPGVMWSASCSLGDDFEAGDFVAGGGSAQPPRTMHQFQMHRRN